MQRVILGLIPWVFLFAAGFLVGDRYGAPGWVSALTDKGFSAVEKSIGGAFSDLISRISEPIPNGEDEADGEGEEATDDTGVETEPQSGEAKFAAGLPENKKLKTNASGLNIIKDSEGLSREPYSKSGQLHIGYGHLIQDGESFESVSEAQAERLLKRDLAYYEDGVRAALTRKANENQFSAMVSLAYDKGIYGFQTTDVLKKFNEGNIKGAANDFRNHTGENGSAPYLVERRERERLLFLKTP